MPPGIESLVNYGVLGILILYVLWALWKIVSRGGSKLMELGDKAVTTGIELGNRYVSTTEALHDTLKEESSARRLADERQREMCSVHASTLQTVSDSIQLQTEFAAKACEHLDMLARAHGSDWQATLKLIHTNNVDLLKVKRAAVHACDMCDHLCKTEFPSSAEKVSQHCDEIKKIIGEA